jgi:hypothetical protein
MARSAALRLGVAIAKYTFVALVALVAYEVLVHRIDHDWDNCRVIRISYSQAIPTSSEGVIVWELAIYPQTGAWNFHGTRRLEAFLELPARVGRPLGSPLDGAQPIELTGTLRPEAASAPR